MKIRPIYLLPLLVLGLAAGSASAQKVGLANPAKIFEEMQERKDAQAQMTIKLGKLKDEEGNRKKEIDALKNQLSQLKTGTPQWTATNQALLQKAIEYNTWIQIQQANAADEQKTLMLSLYTKIQSAVQAVAKKKELDLVIAEITPELPDNDMLVKMDPNQLRAIINGRNIIYNNQSAADITQLVIIQLNADYSRPK